MERWAVKYSMDGIFEYLIHRLKKTVIVSKNISVKAIRSCLFLREMVNFYTLFNLNNVSLLILLRSLSKNQPHLLKYFIILLT